LLEHLIGETESEAAVVELAARLVDVDEAFEGGVEDVAVLAHGVGVVVWFSGNQRAA